MHFWTNLLTQYLPQPSMFRAPDVEMADPLESKREHVSFLMRYHQQRLRKNVDNNPPAIIPDSNLAAGATAGAGVPSPTGKVEVLDIHKDFLAVSESMTKKDPVIATMVSSQTDKYLKCLQYFLLSLEASGYNSEVLIIITENPDPLRRSFSPDPNRLEKLSMPYEGKLILKEIYVPTIEITKHFNKDSQKYSKAMAKIHLWALHTYSIIVYYDLDFIFLRNPIPAQSVHPRNRTSAPQRTRAWSNTSAALPANTSTAASWCSSPPCPHMQTFYRRSTWPRAVSSLTKTS